MTNRTWIDEVKLWGAISSNEGNIVGYLQFGEEAKATINRNINQEFEELLERLPLRLAVGANEYNTHRGYNQAVFEIRTLIKQHIKEMK